MLDKIEILVRAGNGGDGSISFRHEKFAPFGGPDGGDGGKGGDIIIMADPSLNGLNYYHRRRLYQATSGGKGEGKKKHGKRGEDLILKVPLGTIVWQQKETGDTVIADLEQEGQQVIVARGGRGGLGNIHFVSSVIQTPRIAQKGEPGAEASLVLELRLIADVGIIGYPNVGKSTLLAAASAAKPKIANYPFTTTEPMLGVVNVNNGSFVLAEIPGLIEGAHLGRGLGHEFLRHAMRTKMFIHVIDGTSASPVEDMIKVNGELMSFDLSLAQKSQLVAVNKLDLPEVRERVKELRKTFGEVGLSVHFMAAATGEGVNELMAEAMKMLTELADRAKVTEEAPQKVFRPRPRRAGTLVHKEDSVFVIESPELERFVKRIDMSSPEVRAQLRPQMERLGISKALEKAGIQLGDNVRCGEYEWLW